MTAWSAPQPAEQRTWKHGMKMMSRFEPWTVLQRVLGAWAVATLLTACGSSQVETFQPARLIVFGDEASALGTNGRQRAGVVAEEPPRLDVRVPGRAEEHGHVTGRQRGASQRHGTRAGA